MKSLVTLILAAALSTSAFAHEEGKKGPHGGHIAEAGRYHVELVSKADGIEIYLTDADDKALAPTGFKGTAILAVGGKSVRIVLQPTAAALSGRTETKLPDAPKGAILITDPAGKTAQAKFN